MVIELSVLHCSTASLSISYLTAVVYTHDVCGSVRQSVDEKLTGLEEAMSVAVQKIETILRVLVSIEGRRSSRQSK